MDNLSRMNLNYNPFRDITPSMSSSDFVWSEMTDVKSKISKSYEECIQNKGKQLVLNWGPYGGGKTFSAYYFIKNFQQNGVTHIYITCPKEGATATDEFFKSVIDYLSFDVIHNHIQYLLQNRGESELLKFLTPKTSSEYAKAICLIGSNDEEIVSLMNRFLYAGLTKMELKKLGLAKSIESNADSIKFLTGIISCFIDYPPTYAGRIILWIDEMEDLIYYTPKHYKAFSQVLRDLFDSIPDGFLMFMNFTLAEGEENTIELILGGAVWSRITRKIRYKQFSTSNATTYCTELLQHAKIDKEMDKPLTEDTISSVIALIPANDLTPREINKHFRSLLNFASTQNAELISQAVLNQWINDYEENSV